MVRLLALLFLTLLNASYEADASSQAPDRFEKLAAKGQIQANAPVQASSQIFWNLQLPQDGSTLVNTTEPMNGRMRYRQTHAAWQLCSHRSRADGSRWNETASDDDRQMNIALTANGASMRKNARIAKRTWLAQALA